MGTKSNKKNGTKSTGLTPAQLRHIPRPRGGFEAQLEVMVELYRANPEALYQKGATAADLEAELAEYRAMLAAEDAAKKHLATLQEARFVRGSHLWSALLGLYGLGRVVGRTDSAMKRGIASVEQYMRPRHPRARKPTAAPST